MGATPPEVWDAAPFEETTLARRQRFARAYFPGRTGQLLIVPRESDVITRADVAYMHGSPWTYDLAIPLMFAGPAVRTGTYSTLAVQQDVAATFAAALGVQMPPTTTGHVLPALRTGFARPPASMPTLTGLRQRSAWFTQARVNFIPTNTAVGHSTLSTGTDPRVHGITRVNMPCACEPSWLTTDRSAVR